MKNKVILSKYGLSITLALFIASAVHGQACFDIIPKKGCAPLKIRVVSCTADTLTQLYDFNEDGNIDMPDSVWIFDTPGTKMIVQYVISSSDTMYVEVLPAVSPEFSVKSCAGNQAFLELTEKGSYDVFIIDFGDGTAKDTIDRDASISHDYATTGTYTITVQGNFIDDSGNFGSINCGTSTKDFVTTDALLPAGITSLSYVGADSLLLISSMDSAFVYSLDEETDGGGYIGRQRLELSDTTLLLTGLSLQDTSYCYRIATTDSCGGTPVYSEEICNVQLAVDAVPDQVNLSWDRYHGKGFEVYHIIRDGVEIASFSGRARTTYQDTDVLCQQQYCYQVKVSLDYGATSTSNTECITTTSAIIPPSVSELRASTLENSVYIYWANPASIDIQGIELAYEVNADPFTETLTNQEIFEISGIDPSQDQVCALVTITDLCDNSSVTPIPTCQIVLQGEKSDRDNLLSWTPFQGMGDRFTYELERVDEAGSFLALVAAFGKAKINHKDISPTDKVNRYRLKAISTSNTDIIAYSNIVTIEDKLDILIPTAFSPNDDGLNDKFEIFSSTIQTVDIRIFNRWGTIVFQSNSLREMWNGRANGDEAPTGAYTYFITGHDIFGDSFERRGKFMLVR